MCCLGLGWVHAVMRGIASHHGVLCCAVLCCADTRVLLYHGLAEGLVIGSRSGGDAARSGGACGWLLLGGYPLSLHIRCTCIRKQSTWVWM
jgi:hypothetical protein